MAKTLTRTEATEIINTLLDEYSLAHIEVRWDKDNARWITPDVIVKTIKILWWKWTKKKFSRGSWIHAESLDELIEKAERHVQQYHSAKVEKIAGIRKRHADRLLNKELEK